MNKIDFKNKGEVGAIPINADNLNLLQDNVENEFGKIIEIGNDEDKHYIKFDNGTLIQYGYEMYQWVPFHSKDVLYKTDTLKISLPISFTDTYFAYSNVTAVTATQDYWIQNAYITDALNEIGFNAYKTASGNTDIYIRYFAIGKYK